MPAMKLTKSKVEGIKAPDPSGKQVITWDIELAGFGVLASGATAAKTYIAQRRLPDGRTRRVTIGAVGEFTKVEDARRAAGARLLELREGRDPKAERRRTGAGTLRGTLELYLKANKDLRERSRENYRDVIERHLTDWLDRPLREIDPDMIEAKHAAIGEKGGPGAADAAMRTFRALWNFAASRDSTLPPSPTRRLKKAWFALPPRERSVKTDELPAFYKAVDALPSRTHRDYLLLLLYTGLRRNEAAALRWSEEIDFTQRVIRLPASRTKAGRRLNLPMTTFIRDLLIARRALGDDGPFVFGANSKSRHLEEPKFPLAQIAKATGIVVSAHDLRRTWATVAEETPDVSVMALKALINHSLGKDVTSGYVQITVDRLREPAQRICEKMQELCGIAPPEGVELIGERA
jgi:integrase